ncbi:progonadoliberin-2 [Thamnophis elegans]|uniref:progonadoliberin-2 n=1 Tax=Thamnophis elegans TaxID=35005 RepID=UPI0013779B3D|nr:progonadoliberin-2 [Thamnophis elegans]
MPRVTLPRKIPNFPFFPILQDSAEIMAYKRSLLVSFCIVFSIGLQLARAQHWSHGWYPGGKRGIAFPGNFEDSEESKLCDGGGCPFPEVPSDKVVKHLLAGILTGQLQKKK